MYAIRSYYVAHQPSLEYLDSNSRAEMMELVSASIEVLKQTYHPQAFNVGANIGEAAGAGEPGHVHLHIVHGKGGTGD